MPYYIVIDIGCLDCGKSTKVIGIFTSKEKAEPLATGSYFNGQRYLEMFEVAEITE